MSQDDKIHHLQMTQDVIKRMAETSAAMKRYALVSFAAVAALARILEIPSVLGLAALIVFVFWALDAQYLRQEKWFRDIYDEVRNASPSNIDFNLTPSKEIRDRTGIGYGFDSWSTRWLYGPLLVISLLLWLSTCEITTTG